MARFSPGCTGWMIYCPKLDAWWQWKTVWRRPFTTGGFKEQPEVQPTQKEIESAFLESHWWGKHDPKTPQFEWYVMTAQDAQQRRIEQLQTLVHETPAEIRELEQLGDPAGAGLLGEKLLWYQGELKGFLSTRTH
jgi:hypothetical protein